MSSVRIICLLGVFCLPTVALPQQADKSGEVYLDVSSDAVARLQQAEKLIEKKDYQEAVLILRKLVESFPDKIVPLNAETTGSYISLPAYCHLAISKFPAAELANYRKDVDAQAKSLLQQFQSSGDLNALHRIVDEYYCSSEGDVAIAKLGDFAFSQGSFSESVWLWGQLLPPNVTIAGPNNTARLAFELRYPDSDVDVARVAAKWIIAQAMLGQTNATERGIEFLKSKHGSATGKIAGRSGKYWEIAREVIADRNTVSEPVEDSDWRTFAGNISRTKVVPKFFDLGGIRWNWPIDLDANRPANNDNDNERGMIDSRRENLCLFPVIVGKSVYVATERRIWSFNLETGKAEKWPEFQDEAGMPPDTSSMQPKHTLTIDGNRLYVRSGREGTEAPMRMWPRVREVFPSWIHCYDIRSQKKLWQRSAEQLAGPNSVIEGAPIGRDGKVYLSTTRQGAMDTASVLCLDAETGDFRWKTDVCDAVNDAPVQRGSDQTLLTIGNDTCFLSTNLGVVGAVDARTGRKRWVSTYPRTRRRMLAAYGSLPPDLSPCVFHQGKVFVAADDSSEVQCFDASTGARRWTSMTPAMHLLGVSKGMLIASGQRLWGIDVESGKVNWYWPENTAAAFGRGALVGDYVCWPTKTELHFLDQQTGMKARPSIGLFERFRLTGGNIVVGADTFLLAQADRIVAFAPYQKLRDRLQSELTSSPNAAAVHFKIARLAKENADYSRAITEFQLAEKKATPKEMFEGQPLAQLSADQIFQTLIVQAKTAAAERQFAAADALLAKAEATSRSYDTRLVAIRNRIELWTRAKQPKPIVDIYQSIFADTRWNSVYIDQDGARLPVREWALQGIGSVLSQYGRAVYADTEQKAKIEIAKAKTIEEINAVTEIYPASSFACDALLAAADRFSKAGQQREARQTYQRALRFVQSNDEQKVRAYIGLANTNEYLGMERQAREVLTKLAVEFPKIQVPGDKSNTVAQYASHKLKELEEKAPNAALSGNISIQLQRNWQSKTKDGFYYLPAGQIPALKLQTVLRKTNSKLALCKLESSQALWEIAFDSLLVWSAHGSCGLLIASPTKLQCHDYLDGKLLWSVSLRDPPKPNPAPAAKANRPATISGIRMAQVRAPFAHHRFVITEQSVIALRAKKITAIDSETGALRWEIPWEDSELTTWLQRIGNSVLVGNRDKRIAYDLISGRRQFEFGLRGGVHNLPAVVCGDVLISAVDRATIAGFDLNKRTKLWTKTTVWPTMELPRLMSASSRVYLLCDGYELTQVDPATGKNLMQAAIHARPNAIGDNTVVCGSGHFVATSGDWVECRTLENGAVAWRMALPPSPNAWKIDAVGDTFIAYSLVDAKGTVLCWSSEGKLLQTLNFDRPGTGSSLEISFPSAILSGTEKSWGLALSLAPAKSEKPTIPATSP